MNNKSKSAYALAFLALGVWASSSAYQDRTAAPKNTTHILAETMAPTSEVTAELPAAHLSVSQVSPALVSGKFSFVTFGPEGLPARWDPCSSLTWRIDWSNAPEGFPKKFFKRNAVSAMRQIRKATGLQILANEETPLPSILVRFARTKDMPAEDAVGYASIIVSEDHSEIVHVDIILDADAADRLEYGWAGWKNVILHEMGHAVGLNHAKDSSQVMFEFSNGTEKFKSGDLAGLRQLGAANGCFNR